MGYARQSPVRYTDPRGQKTLAVGGFFDATTENVTTVADDEGWEYFSHLDGARLQARIIVLAAQLEANECEKINVVGHSWGGETAAKAAKKTAKKVDLLVTVDPVSGFDWPHPGGIAQRWINVYSAPTNRNSSDNIKSAGTNPGSDVGIHPRFANADDHRKVPGAHHADFLLMLRSSGTLQLLD